MRTLFVDTFSEYRNTRDKVCTKLKKDDDDDEEKKKNTQSWVWVASTNYTIKLPTAHTI